MPQTKKKKVTKIKIVRVILALLILYIIYLLMKHFLALPIKNIYVLNSNILSDQEIIELAKIDNYPSFYWTSSKSIQRRILANPFIKEVKVTKHFFNRIKIEIVEYDILFQKESDKKIVLENKEEILYDDHNLGLPLLINYVPDVKYEKLITEMKKVKKEVRRQISEIEYCPNEYDKDRFLLYMVDGNSVYLTLTKFNKINYYIEALPEFEGKKGIWYLDSGDHFLIME